MDVAEDDIGHLPAGDFQPGRSRRGFEDVIAMDPKRFREGKPEPIVVIDKKNGFHVA
jgi:hypothetical protein